MKPLTSRRRLLSGALAATLLPSATRTLAQPTTDAPVPCTSVAPGRWISLAALENSLPSSPMTVGFDIDDTLVFSSPSFNAVLSARDESGVNPYGANRRAVIANPKTWEDLHSIHDAYVLPKAIATPLLALHQRRGDRIHLITARFNVKGELLEQRIRDMFKFDLAGPVLFAAMKPKTELIKANGIQLYYGDSDSDIEYAQAAGARGVRVARATNAIEYDRLPTNGKFGEDVLINSDR